MDFQRYQQAAVKTLQSADACGDAAVGPLLGLVATTGSLASAYGQHLRDGNASEQGKQQFRDGLGEVLWHAAGLAHRLGLRLDDVAVASVENAKDRWRVTPAAELTPFDAEFPVHEQLPRETVVTFALGEDKKGRAVVEISRADGEPAGDPLTDASRIEDDYRFHDAFHLAHAAVLGWSPVTRFLLGCKRRSRPDFDEAEDGGRAIAIEEGISALVFTYAARHGYLRDARHIDHELLATIGQMTSHLEVGACRAADWEQAILAGYNAWWQLRTNRGGQLRLDLNERTLRYLQT
jgi:hypothetical protein